MEIDHEALRERVGFYAYRLRMNLQAIHSAFGLGTGRTILHPENIPLVRHGLEAGLRLTGLRGWARRQARRHEVTEHRWQLRRLPEAFRGYRILHLSDFHIDAAPDIVECALERIGGLEYDLCVVTGDYRGETTGDIGPAMRLMAGALARLRGPVYGVLGNHDWLEMLPPLEAAGMRMLVNESVRIERGGDCIYLAGVDDPHYYEMDNIERAAGAIPLEATKILLSHSAENHRRALAAGIDLMLCGHTHGGQFCLPGGRAIINNAAQPRWMGKGAWQYHDLQGYTTRGIGVSIVPYRFFCPPEISVHVLDRAALL